MMLTLALGAGSAGIGCSKGGITNSDIPAFADNDRDGIPDDGTDPCIDTDRDGLGDPEFLLDACPDDPCPTDPSNTCTPVRPLFPDYDHDSIPDDGTDRCIDTDRDGFGDPGFLLDTCPDDPCPNDPANTCPLIQPPFFDYDGDGIPDQVDTCIDRDGDGFGDPEFLLNQCPRDRCPSDPTNTCTVQGGLSDVDRDGVPDIWDNCGTVPNFDQADTDRDGRGNACDPCPNAHNDDPDRDGLCSNNDNCPFDANVSQSNADGDTYGDACDSCTDTDGDGWGNPGYPANGCEPDNFPNDPSQH